MDHLAKILHLILPKNKYATVFFVGIAIAFATAYFWDFGRRTQIRAEFGDAKVEAKAFDAWHKLEIEFMKEDVQRFKEEEAKIERARLRLKVQADAAKTLEDYVKLEPLVDKLLADRRVLDSKVDKEHEAVRQFLREAETKGLPIEKQISRLTVSAQDAVSLSWLAFLAHTLAGSMIGIGGIKWYQSSRQPQTKASPVSYITPNVATPQNTPLGI